MFNPCVEHCWNRLEKQYSKKCDNTCEFAKTAKELNKYKKLFGEIYEIYKKYFDEYDGKLVIPMNMSELICDLAGHECSLILQDMMYERWVLENSDSEETKTWHTNKEK